MKRKIGIKELLEWAFGSELAKVGAGGDGLSSVGSSNWDVTREMAVLGTIIDKSPNNYGVVPGFIIEGDPHPDAVKVGDAVRALGAMTFDIPEGWNPMADFEDPHGLVATEVARVACQVQIKGDRLSGRHAVNLVTSAAILKRGPDWRCDVPEFRMVMNGNKPGWFVCKSYTDQFGRTQMLEKPGFDRSRNRPLKGAYRKYEFKRPIAGDILSRLEWQIWQDALEYLAGTLNGRLESYEIIDFVPRRTPWGTLAAKQKIA